MAERIMMVFKDNSLWCRLVYITHQPLGVTISFLEDVHVWYTRCFQMHREKINWWFFAYENLVFVSDIQSVENGKNYGFYLTSPTAFGIWVRNLVYSTCSSLV